MNDHDFWAEMRAEPEADLPRLAYADWLDEQGDGRGEFVRLSVRAARLRIDEPDGLRLRAEAETAFRRYAQPWLSQLPNVERCGHYRGMLRPTLRAGDILETDILTDLPIEGVRLRNIRARASVLSHSEKLGVLRWLSLKDCRGRSTDFQMLLASPTLVNLETLVIDGQASHPGLVEVLAHWSHPHLKHVVLTENVTTERELRAFVESRLFREQLETFYLNDVNVMDVTNVMRRGLHSETLRRVNARTFDSMGRRGWRPNRWVDTIAPNVIDDLPAFESVTWVEPADSSGWLPLSDATGIRRLIISDPLVSPPLETIESVPESVERLEIRLREGGEASFAERLIHAIGDQLRSLKLSRLEDKPERLVDPLLNHVRSLPGLEQLDLSSPNVSQMRTLFADPDAFPTLRTLHLSFIADLDCDTVVNAFTPPVSLDEVHATAVYFRGEQNAEAFLASPLVQQTRTLVITPRQYYSANFLFDALSKTVLPRLRVLRVLGAGPTQLVAVGDRKNMPLAEWLPGRKALPNLESLSFNITLQDAIALHFRQQFGPAFDPDGRRGALAEPYPTA